MILETVRYFLDTGTDSVIKETLYFISPDTSKELDLSDKRLRPLPNEQGLYFFYQGENLAADINYADMVDGKFPDYHQYWSPLNIPVRKELIQISEADYTARQNFTMDKANEVVLQRAKQRKEILDKLGMTSEQLDILIGN
jgi:hypothetical protein